MATNETGLELRSIIKSLLAKNYNQVKFTEEYVTCAEKHVLVKKMFKNGVNMGLPQQAWVKNTVHGVEAHYLVKKKYQAQRLDQ